MQIQAKKINFNEDTNIQILFLRNILRKNKTFSGCQLFGKFGIGVTKYEICSNLKASKILNLLFTEVNTKSLIKYNIKAQTFSKEQVKTETFGPCHRALQVSENEVFVTGDNNNMKRFSYIKKMKAQDHETIFQRSDAGIAFHKERRLVFLIAGYYKKNDCEVFDMQSKNFYEIQKYPINTGGVSCFIRKDELFSIGGRYTQNIYIYKIQLDI